LRLSRYEKKIEKETKELEQGYYHHFLINPLFCCPFSVFIDSVCRLKNTDHRRIDELREKLRVRAVAMEEARKRYHTGNEYLEESLRKLERDRFVCLVCG